MNDSIWATVLGIAKTFGITAHEALYDISYVNAIMYSKAMPMYDDKQTEDDNKPVYDDALDANDTSKFNDFEDEEIVRV